MGKATPRFLKESRGLARLANVQLPKEQVSQMGLMNPDVGSIDGKFSEVIGDGQPFVLHGIETVEGVKTKDYGEGTMVVLDCEPDGGERKHLGIWGDYLVLQAKAVEPDDLGKVYAVVRGPVDGYSQRPDTKSLRPVA